MQRLRPSGQLTAAQDACFDLPRAFEFLYDVQLDPDCLHNLARNPEFQDTLKRLRSALTDWQSETGDRFPGAAALTPDGFDRESGQRIIEGSHPSGKSSI
jgi:hypothetical protein